MPRPHPPQLTPGRARHSRGPRTARAQQQRHRGERHPPRGREERAVRPSHRWLPPGRAPSPPRGTRAARPGTLLRPTAPSSSPPQSTHTAPARLLPPHSAPTATTPALRGGRKEGKEGVRATARAAAGAGTRSTLGERAPGDQAGGPSRPPFAERRALTGRRHSVPYRLPAITLRWKRCRSLNATVRAALPAARPRLLLAWRCLLRQWLAVLCAAIK